MTRPLVVVGDDCVEDLASAGAAAEQQSSITFSQLRAEADWGAIAAEYLHGARPATPLGASH